MAHREYLALEHLLEKCADDLRDLQKWADAVEEQLPTLHVSDCMYWVTEEPQHCDCEAGSLLNQLEALKRDLNGKWEPSE